MPIHSFEDLEIWKKSKDLTSLVYLACRECKDFKFKDQIQSAALSVMNNVAEGFERQGKKEFQRFLYISKGSAGEVRSMAYMAKELKYVSDVEFNSIHNLSTEISRMIVGLIRVL